MTSRDVSQDRTKLSKNSIVALFNLSREGRPIDKAIDLCISCMKWQVFVDGNKRAAIIYANHYLISQGGGLLVVPEQLVPTFRPLLIAHYEGTGTGDLIAFMKESCWQRFGE